MPIVSHIAGFQPGKMAAVQDCIMNARTISPEKSTPVAPRFDRKFIEDHKLLERYLENKLPFKGARDLENWCKANPEYLSGLKLSERAQTSLKLLEASGAPVDLREPSPPWWKSVYVLIGCLAVAFFSLVAFWFLFGKYEALGNRLDESRQLLTRGSMVQPASERSVAIAPDHSPGLDQARVVVNHNAPELLDLRIDLGYTNKLNQFRMFVDKKEQGRALILNNLLKDSNGELRLTLNSTGIGPGIYTVRIEALVFKGSPIPVGWLILEVR
jgi:hypothetical protein